MSKKIELSVSELMQYRNDGYSNKDIARILDISVATVYNYIGKQGCRIPSATASFISKPTTPPENEQKKTPEVTLVSRVVSIGGYLFELQSLTGTISVSFADGQSVKIDDLDGFINALWLARDYKQRTPNE